MRYTPPTPQVFGSQLPNDIPASPWHVTEEGASLRRSRCDSDGLPGSLLGRPHRHLTLTAPGRLTRHSHGLELRVARYRVARCLWLFEESSKAARQIGSLRGLRKHFLDSIAEKCSLAHTHTHTDTHIYIHTHTHMYTYMYAIYINKNVYIISVYMYIH